MKKILIIAAMADVELNYLIENLEEKIIEETNICKFYIGKMFENEVILCDSKVGIINATASITLAIEKFHPDYIINAGCAGGFGEKVHKGDLVIGTKCINITSIRTKYRKIGEGTNLNDWELINFIAGEEDRLVPQRAGEALISATKSIKEIYKDGNVHYGVIGSGDIWNKESDTIMLLNKKYDILCEDMEGVAILTVANLYNIQAIDIRVISDNEILKEDYERGISIKVQKFVEQLLQNL